MPFERCIEIINLDDVGYNQILRFSDNNVLLIAGSKMIDLLGNRHQFKVVFADDATTRQATDAERRNFKTLMMQEILEEGEDLADDLGETGDDEVLCEEVTINAGTPRETIQLVQYLKAEKADRDECLKYLTERGHVIATKPHPVVGPNDDPAVSWGDLADVID